MLNDLYNSINMGRLQVVKGHIGHIVADWGGYIKHNILFYPKWVCPSV